MLSRVLELFRVFEHGEDRFIGLGTMGLCMARNLIRKGHEVIGFDFSKVVLDAHVKNGGSIAISAAEAAADADFVLTMLPHGDAVKDAALGPNGAVKRMSMMVYLSICQLFIH